MVLRWAQERAYYGTCCARLSSESCFTVGGVDKQSNIVCFGVEVASIESEKVCMFCCCVCVCVCVVMTVVSYNLRQRGNREREEKFPGIPMEFSRKIPFLDRHLGSFPTTVHFSYKN